MTDQFAAFDALLSDAVNSMFGEEFQFLAYTVSGDSIDGPRIADTARPAFTAVGQWVAQTKSKTPTARGAIQDDNAHGWTASHPEAHVDDVQLLWQVRPFDRVLRVATGELYQISAPPRPDGMGHTCFQLTSKRSTPAAP